MEVRPLGGNVGGNANDAQEHSPVAGMNVRGEPGQRNSYNIQERVEDHDWPSNPEVICEEGAEHDPDRGRGVGWEGQQLGSAGGVAKPVVQDDREKVRKGVNSCIVESEVAGEFPELPVLKVPHCDFKGELVFGSITAIVLNTSQHNGGFFWREETRQANGVFAGGFFGKVDNDEEGGNSDNCANDTFLYSNA